MQKKLLSRQRLDERGQTIVLVAISLVSLLAMAALAIDIVTLYVARSEVQRAADAAALAAAKGIADSGFTTLPSTDSNYPTAQVLAQTMAVKAVNAILTSSGINLINGQLPVLVAAPSFDFTTHPGSYQVTVSLKSASLPTFFSKIWAQSSAFVTASATAEAYNPSNLQTITPISLRSVKPWLVGNKDPRTGNAFVTNGVVESNAIQNLFSATIDLVSECTTAPCNPAAPPTSIGTSQLQYVPVLVSNPSNSSNICPASNPPCGGGTPYENSVECADTTIYAGPHCGLAADISWDNNTNPSGVAGPTAAGGECLIHAAGPGPYDGLNNLQDRLDPTPWPNNPMKITADSGPFNTQLVTTSSSIVTIPILDNASVFPATGGTVSVVGYLQAFINQIDSGTGLAPAGSINITVLNIAGCSATNNGAPPVVGGAGTSPIPVRLITPP
jgi:Flp pilus assembly protein TadG